MKNMKLVDFMIIYYNGIVPKYKDRAFWSNLIIFMSLESITSNGRKVKISDIFKELEESIMIYKTSNLNDRHGFLFDSWLNTKGSIGNPLDPKWDLRFAMLDYHYKKVQNEKI